MQPTVHISKEPWNTHNLSSRSMYSTRNSRAIRLEGSIGRSAFRLPFMYDMYMYLIVSTRRVHVFEGAQQCSEV